MSGVTIYTRARCGYCHAALHILAGKKVSVRQIDAGSDPAARAEMLARSSGQSTYPQIFIADTHIGGFDQLSALDASGALDSLLGLD